MYHSLVNIITLPKKNIHIYKYPHILDLLFFSLYWFLGHSCSAIKLHVLKNDCLRFLFVLNNIKIKIKSSSDSNFNKDIIFRDWGVSMGRRYSLFLDTPSLVTIMETIQDRNNSWLKWSWLIGQTSSFQGKFNLFYFY